MNTWIALGLLYWYFARFEPHWALSNGSVWGTFAEFFPTSTWHNRIESDRAVWLSPFMCCWSNATYRQQPSVNRRQVCKLPCKQSLLVMHSIAAAIFVSISFPLASIRWQMRMRPYWIVTASRCYCPAYPSLCTTMAKFRAPNRLCGAARLSVVIW